MYHLYMDSIDISNIYLQSKTIKLLFLPFFSSVLGGVIFICKAHFCFYTIIKSVLVI